MIKASLVLALASAAFVNAAPASSSNCPPLQVFHVAGTTENGLGIVGDALAKFVPQYVKDAKVVPVYYNTAPEYAVTVKLGTQQLTSDVTDFALRCPKSDIAITGYSKGALVGHDTMFTDSLKARVSSFVTFGDPAKPPSGSAVLTYNYNNIPTANQGCFFTYCNKGDLFCDGGVSIEAHLAYPNDGSADKGAQNIASCHNKKK